MIIEEVDQTLGLQYAISECKKMICLPAETRHRWSLLVGLVLFVVSFPFTDSSQPGAPSKTMLSPILASLSVLLAVAAAQNSSSEHIVDLGYARYRGIQNDSYPK